MSHFSSVRRRAVYDREHWEVFLNNIEVCISSNTISIRDHIQWSLYPVTCSCPLAFHQVLHFCLLSIVTTDSKHRAHNENISHDKNFPHCVWSIQIMKAWKMLFQQDEVVSFLTTIAPWISFVHVQVRFLLLANRSHSFALDKQKKSLQLVELPSKRLQGEGRYWNDLSASLDGVACLLSRILHFRWARVSNPEQPFWNITVKTQALELWVCQWWSLASAWIASSFGCLCPVCPKSQLPS